MKLTIKTAEDLENERLSRERERVRATAQEYLTQTDWFVVRASETGKPVPSDVLARRADARAVLSGEQSGFEDTL